jgi:PBSX family phage terminase large subunit
MSTFSISSKQLRSIKESNAKINIWEGAVRSGKTYASLWRFIFELRKGTEGEYAIITRTYDSFKRNLMPQIERMIGFDARHYSGKREMHVYGKTVHIIGADDERAESKIRGATFEGAYVDETTIIPESVFKMLISRCAMGGARIFATTNPESPFHWLKKDFLTSNPDVKSWQFKLDDNPELTDNEKEYLKRQYRGLWYQRFIEGRWVQAEGAIYDFFDTSIHCMDYSSNTPEYYILGIDYGTSNACAFVLVGVNRQKYPNVWVEDEYYYDSKVQQRQKTDSEYATDLIKFIQGKPLRNIYIDPSAASFKVELQKQGVQNLRDADNEVIDGIRLVSNFLNNGTLKICRKAKNLIQEFQSYVWDSNSSKTGIDKPLKKNDHAIDALRYAIYSNFFNKSECKIDWDKEQREAYGFKPDIPRFFQDDQDGLTPFRF